MLKRWMALGALAAALLSAPAMARDGYGVGYGRNDRHSDWSRHNSHNRNRAWIDNDRGHWGGHHRGNHWNSGHDHFSPRGQGGHHWGW